ncbi:MAG TPA: cation:proton antiporter [Nitrososphaeraceae archaeon]|nr:cation:proton antiporter [Nitrososphaeraceae archaeon]
MAVTEVGQILQDLSVIMIIAGGMAMLSWRFKQPLIVGYIGAGMIIGPHTPPFSLILNLDVLNLFAEIGIVLLLFVVGMEFPIEKLRKVGRKAFIIALSEALGTFSIGFIVGQYALSFPFYDSLFLALAVSVTSTVIVMRVLEELGMIKEESSVLILSVAIIEDIIVISMLAILQSTSSTGGLSFADIGISVGITLAFIVGVLVIGSKTVPRMVDYVSRTNQHDVLVVIFLAVVFGLSFIAYQLGISVATGAFFAGVLIAESKSHSVSRVLATPIRDMFAALFFVSVGALMDISLLPIFIVPAVVLVIVSLIAKFLTVYLASRFQGLSKLTSLRAGTGLSSSGGELALVVAKGGGDIGVTSSFLLPMVGAMTIITTFISPYVIKFGWRFAEAFVNKRKKV